MCVVPEKPDGGADHRPAEDGHLRDLGHMGKLEVIGKHGVAADVGEHRERSSSNYSAANRQSIETIGEIHGVAGAHNDDGHEREERQKRQWRKIAVVQSADHQVWPEMLEEGHNQTSGVQPMGFQSTQDRAYHKAV